MTSIFLLFILSLAFIHSANCKIKPKLTYISNPKKSKVERFFNFGTIEKLRNNLKSSLLPANVTNQILNFKGKEAKIAYDEMRGNYKLSNYYGRAWKEGKIIYYEIFHSDIEASPKKFKTETIDCNRKWYTLWIKKYCYKKIRKIARAPTAREKLYIKKELMKESNRTRELKKPKKFILK